MDEEVIAGFLKKPSSLSLEEQKRRSRILKRQWKKFLEEQKKLAEDPEIQEYLKDRFEAIERQELLEEYMFEEYLPIGKVAKIFKVSTETIRKWIKKGKLRAIRTLGGHRRIPVKDVLNMIEERMKLHSR